MPRSLTCSEPALMSLTEIAEAIAAKQVSSREVVDSCLARIKRWQPKLNAFVAVEPDEALRAADAADEATARGQSGGALHGVPLAHKDMFYDAGKVVTCGSQIRKNWIATTTSTAISRLRSAGAIRMGALSMDEFAYGPTGHNFHFGAVRNPWNPLHVSGGSSSGPASAVAACLTFASLGSDTGGSIRVPAHFCGVTGLKTTKGRLSRAGTMPLSHSLDSIGPIARTVEDCALLLELVADAGDQKSAASLSGGGGFVASTRLNARGMRIGLPTSFYVDDLDGDIAGALDEAIEVMQAQGATVVKVALPDQASISAACQIVLAAEAAAFHKSWLIERPAEYSRTVLNRIRSGLGIPATTYLEALRWRGAALASHLAATQSLDAVLAPVTPNAAPTIKECDIDRNANADAVIKRLTHFTRPANFLGLPSLAFPAGFSANGMPVGLQLIGRPFDEATLLRLGAAFQRATDFHEKRPSWT